MKYIYMIMPVGLGAMVLVSIELGLRCLLGIIRPDDPVARAPSAQPGIQRS